MARALHLGWRLIVACEGTGTGSASLRCAPSVLRWIERCGAGDDNSFPERWNSSPISDRRWICMYACRAERVIVQIQNRPEQPLPVIGEQVHIGWSKSTGRYSKHNFSANQSRPGGTHMTQSNPARVLLGQQHFRRRQPAAPGYRRSRRRIVVGTWGGDIRPSAQQEYRGAAAHQDGWEVVAGSGRRPRTALEMLAEKRLPRGTSDVQGLRRSTCTRWRTPAPSAIDTQAQDAAICCRR